MNISTFHDFFTFICKIPVQLFYSLSCFFKKGTQVVSKSFSTWQTEINVAIFCVVSQT
jgi:hypothetical protein